MIRRESARLMAPDEANSESNTLAGTLRDTLVTGSTIKHFVAVPGDVTMIVQELANERRTMFARGEKVVVRWPVEAGIFLDR
jgi:putative spermidine/putrescine transport system ATP-binding protein